VRETALAYYARPENYRLGVMPGLEHIEGEITPNIVATYLKLMLDRRLLRLYKQVVFNPDPAKLETMEKELRDALQYTVSELPDDEFPLLVKYIYWNVYNTSSELKEKSLTKMLRHWLGVEDLDENTQKDLVNEILNRK
jgi:hypothetical protein